MFFLRNSRNQVKTDSVLRVGSRKETAFVYTQKLFLFLWTLFFRQDKLFLIDKVAYAMKSDLAGMKERIHFAALCYQSIIRNQPA